jgi:predicted SAM-dependent methyltransferase
MKLNVGCGYKYLRGYLNVDSGVDSLADAVMEAHDLRLPSSSAEEIVAGQLIEHLGFFKTKYFLAECFRVLLPGGLLTLETPDIEKTFREFLSGDDTVRESALSWAYGAESPGMQHIFCFPAELLREMAVEAGFEIDGEEFFDYQQHRPALRLILRKNPVDVRRTFFAELRKRLIGKKIPAFEDELTIAAQEEVLRRLAIGDPEDRGALLRLAVHSAEIVREYFGLETDSVRGSGRYETVAARLAECRFQDRLLRMLRENKAGAGRQEAAYRETLEHGVGLVDLMVQSGIRELSPPEGEALRVFLPPVIKGLAERTFARGLKAYCLERYPEATDCFRTAVEIYRDDPFLYWNAARTYKIMGKVHLARQQYESARTALETCPPLTRRLHREALEAEMRELGM